MSRNTDNRKRAFADVVTVEAWHAPFDAANQTVDLHADVVFGTARVGGETDSPVRFRLSVRRAEIVIVIPESEPLSIERQSVSRDAPELRGKLTEVVEKAQEGSVKGAANAKISSTGVDISATSELTGGASISTRQKMELSSEVHFMIVIQSRDSEGNYRWQLEPHAKDKLEGRPWDAKTQPRLKIKDERKNPQDRIPPTVRVEVRCRQEDLIIEGLEIKDQNIWNAASHKLGFKNNMAAAISYIRKVLTEEGLEADNIEDIFGRVTLASTTAEPT
jgi:hypothetical protein